MDRDLDLKILTEIEKIRKDHDKEQAYQKTMAEQLEEIAAGGGGGGGGNVLNVTATVNVSESKVVLDKTWKEINDAVFAIVSVPNGGQEGKATGVVVYTELYQESYRVIAQMTTFDNSQNAVWTASVFSTDSENGYPYMSIGG